SGPQQVNRLGQVTEPSLKCPEVREFVRRELALPRSLFEFRGSALVRCSRGTGGHAGGWFNADRTQHSLIEEKTAPLRRQFVLRFAGVVETCPRGNRDTKPAKNGHCDAGQKHAHLSEYSTKLQCFSQFIRRTCGREARRPSRFW